MKVNKADLLKTLKQDLSSAKDMKAAIDQRVAERRDIYNGKLYGNEEDGKSKIVVKLAKRQSEWGHAKIKDPFVSTPEIVKCNPITFEDVQAARQNELLLNYQFCRQFDRYKFMTKAIKVLDVDATLVVQTGWVYEDEEITQMTDVVEVDEYGNEFITTQRVPTIRVKKNQPTARVCRSEDVFIDPTCQDDIDNAQFVIFRYETDLSTLKKDGRYKNLDKLKEAGDELSSDEDFDPEDETEFKFSDKARKKLLVYEYWGNYDIDDDGEVEPIVCAWIGGTIIRLGSNPYPDKRPPFIVVPFSSVPFQLHGENNIDLIEDNQKVITATTRGIINNMAQSTNGQVGIRKGALDAIQRKKFFSGKNFEFNGSPADFWQGSFNQIPGSAFDMMALQNNEAESLTGTKAFSQGLTGNALGTMLDINTNIPMHDGSSKLLRDIVDGDVIVSSTGAGTTVTTAHEISLPKKAYNLTFSNGDTIAAGVEHLWTVKIDVDSTKGTWHTVDTETLVAYYSQFTADTRRAKKKRSVYIPRITRVDNGAEWPLVVDPYLLGYWLGDGNTNEGKITTMDSEIVEYYTAAGYDLREESTTGQAKVYRINKGTAITTFTADLVASGLSSSSSRIVKHIPQSVFTSGYYGKLELVRGLVDSDGYVPGKSGYAQIVQAEGQLKDDIVRLLKSMGANVVVSSVDAAVANSRKARSVLNGAKDIVSKKTCYKIGFTLPDCPARLSRKANKWVTPAQSSTYSLVSVQEIAPIPMRCLTVDSEDRLYACGHAYTLTHNTATGVRSTLDATASRTLDTVRNIAENLIKPLMRKWMAYNSEFLSEEEVVRVTNSEFVPIRRDDLAGNIDIDIAISTAEDNSMKMQELTFLLQTLGNTLPFELTQKVLAQIARLSRQPELEKDIEAFKPQPDPMAEQMKQLEMAKLQAEVQYLQARSFAAQASAGEDDADKAEKLAQAELKRAQARKLMSEADNLDLKYIADDGQVKHQEDLEKEQMKHQQKLELEDMKRLARLDEMAFQMKYGSKNEQIGVPK